ncbi:MAG: DUF402 domain-containing protein [Anaerolineaceae bacterium]|jgi:predicted RNA-binding protein associated with RNAse of E/G family
MSEITVIKRNLQGEETWRYSGLLIGKGDHSMVIEAYFNKPDLSLHGMLFGNGDRFVEVYFDNRWYNIFQIHNRQDDSLKGWYCNVTRPAVFRPAQIDYIDLALDLLVFPDGRQLVLDQEEFNILPLDDSARQQALKALRELQQLVAPSAGFRVENLLP